jgi:glycosyltransferase involved in cell wall biosynthesis
MGCCYAFVLPSEERINYLGIWEKYKKVFVIINTCYDELYKIPKESKLLSYDENKIKIGFFGYLHKSRGSNQLLEIAKKFPDKVEIYVAGKCRSPELIEEIKMIKNVFDK